ncbi:MAG: YcxB family protein [Alphaproteobacteria bacterium]|nr:YcxB family protein [Alphaproteobacteria bacterium]MBL7098724.1 YcxB family protein [Alphaproteobacteria bacterium]
MDGVIRGSTTITLGDQLRARWNRSTRYATLVLAIVIAAMVAFDLRRIDTSLDFAISVFAALTTVLLFVGGYLLFMLIVFALLALRLSKEQRAMSYEFGPENIVMKDGTGAMTTTPWTIVRRARERKNAMTLDVKPMGFRYVPKRAFAAAELPALRALVKSKLGPLARLRSS